MKAHKIVQGHYTVQVDGATYDIKRKSYRVGKGTSIRERRTSERG